MHQPLSQPQLAQAEPYETLSLRLAEAIKKQIQAEPESRLGLPTGRTPTGCYRLLGRWSKEGELDWSRVKCFALDEYIDSEESKSFRQYLETQLFRYTNLPRENRFSPYFCDDYDRLIETFGGLDLTILGIGKNGHIAFNEPGTPRDSYTHSLWLTESTRLANAEFFGKLDQTPTRAVTMGIKTILNSRKIILVASGKGKSAILKEALEGPITEKVPASFLQTHGNVVVMTDFGYEKR